MGKWLVAMLLVLAAGAGAGWYWLYRPQEQALAQSRTEAARLQAEAARVAAEARKLEGRVADLEAASAELQRSSAELAQRVQEKEAQLAALRGTQDEIVGSLKKEIENNQVQVERYRDQLRVDVVDELLFDSGEADLKPGGKAVLQKVGQALGKTEDRRIEVLGHTDNVPIVGALARRYPTNWELSSARAVNVARFLQEGGVDPRRLSAVAFSQYQPRAGNDTEQGKRKNRRIEILLGPRVAPEKALADGGRAN
jgi:chemotaxis protein MotB